MQTGRYATGKTWGGGGRVAVGLSSQTYTVSGEITIAVVRLVTKFIS